MRDSTTTWVHTGYKGNHFVHWARRSCSSTVENESSPIRARLRAIRARLRAIRARLRLTRERLGAICARPKMRSSLLHIARHKTNLFLPFLDGLVVGDELLSVNGGEGSGGNAGTAATSTGLTHLLDR